MPCPGQKQLRFYPVWMHVLYYACQSKKWRLISHSTFRKSSCLDQAFRLRIAFPGFPSNGPTASVGESERSSRLEFLAWQGFLWMNRMSEEDDVWSRSDPFWMKKSPNHWLVAGVIDCENNCLQYQCPGLKHHYTIKTPNQPKTSKNYRINTLNVEKHIKTYYEI